MIAGELGIEALGAMLRRRELSPVDLATRLLQRVSERDGELHAFLHIDQAQLLQDARSAEDELSRGTWRGPLHGVPIAIKDNIDVAGMRTTCHSAILADAPPAAADAKVVALLRQAGAIVMGKTALHEFGVGGPTHELPWPAARNPWNPTLHPGGSSSGSAVAVAAGFAPGAVGTDTSGSIRHPASSCGLFALKPTYDLVSRAGVFPLAFSLDHVGPMARSAMDCAILLDAMIPPSHPLAGMNAQAARAGAAQGIAGMRIGVVEHMHLQEETADPQVVQGFELAIDKLRELGANVSTVILPPLAQWNACCRVIQQCEQYAVHEEWLQHRAQDYCEISRTKLLAGAFLTARDYMRATQLRTLLCRSFENVMREFDALAMPSSLHLPCALDDAELIAKTYERHLRAPFSVTGTPGLAVPTGRTPQGIPLGLQLGAKALHEPVLFRIAAALQTAA